MQRTPPAGRRTGPDASDVAPAIQVIADEGSGELIEYAPPRRTMDSPTVRTVLVLAMPTIAEQLISAAIGLTDSIVAGHIRGDAQTVAAASAAVGVMCYLQWFIGLMTAAFAVGGTAIIARSIGERRVNRAQYAAGTAMAGAFIVGVAVAAGFMIFPAQIIHLSGLRGLAGEYGQQYLRIMAFTVALQTVAQIGMASLRGSGDTFRPMLITGATAIVNVATTTCLSFGLLGLPEMGIRGNALGTMVAYFLAGSVTLLVLFTGMGKLRLRLRHIRLAPKILSRLLRIGMPSWFESMLLWFGQFVVVIFAITPTDKAVGVTGVTMAAHNAVLRIESLAFLPGFGFGIAASVLVGQYLGARQAEDAKRAAHLCARMAVITMTAAALPMVVFPHFLLGVMVNSSPVVETGVWPMVLAGLAQPAFAVAIVAASGLKGAGETTWPMVSTTSGMFLVRMPILFGVQYLFTRAGHPQWGLIAVWLGILADLHYRAVFNAMVFIRGGWQTKRI